MKIVGARFAHPFSSVSLRIRRYLSPRRTDTGVLISP